MSKFASLLGAALALAMVAPITTASAGQIPKNITPAGHWEVSTGESRYDIRFCGDGTQICATLTWLRDDVRTPENLAYLNKMVVEGAKKTAPVKWEGQVIYEGEAYSGALTMLSSHQMKMAGCKAIACNTMIFNRI